MNITQKTFSIQVYTKAIFLYFALVLCSQAAWSFTNKPHVVNIARNKYGAENKNWAIAQDEKGVVYFGNDGGLLEFDGVLWKLYAAQGNQVVRSLYVVSNNLVFSGGYEEFGKWERSVSGELVYTSLSSSIEKAAFKNGDFWKIIEVGGLIYFQSFNSLFVLDQHTNEVSQIEGMESFLLLQEVRGEIYFQQMRGALYKIKNKTEFEKLEGSDFLADADVRVFLPFGEDKVLIGSNTKGLYIYDGKVFKEWNAELSKQIIPTDLNCGFLSQKGTYYFGTLINGMYEVDVDGKIIGHVSVDSDLQNNTVLSLFQDETGSIWAGLDRGISYIDYEKNISFYTDPTGVTGAIYDAVEWNNVLVLATNKGVHYLDLDKMVSSNVLPTLKPVANTRGQVWALEVINGELYCGHDRGLKKITKDFVAIDLTDKSGVYSINKTKVNHKDVLLLSTYYGIQIFDLDTQKGIPIKKFTDPIISTQVDHLDNIWLEHTNKGVYRTRLGQGEQADQFSQYSYYGGGSKDGLPYKLRLFKVGGRVEMMGDSRFFSYDDVKDVIVENDRLNDCFNGITGLQQIIHHSGNYYWALGKTTIYLFSYDGYSAFIVDSYDVNKHGLSLVNVYEKASTLNDSLSLVCLDNGFFLYDFKTLKDQFKNKLSTPYLKTVESIDENGSRIYLDVNSEDAAVAYSHNAVSFIFTAQNAFALNLSFSYKLVGVDKDWSEEQKYNSVSYARLPAGKYEFLMRTKDSLGNYSDITSFKFTISKPYYATIWAYLLYIVLVGLLLYLIWMMVLRRYRNLHLQKIRLRETKRLHALTRDLQQEVETKNAEMLTQASFIIQKNRVIQSVKDLVDEFYEENSVKAIIPLQHKITALLNKNNNSEEDWKMFLIKFEEKHTGFFKKIKNMYPELTTGDLRLCACLKLNLETKEIASLMNLSVRAVENNRYRLRKKMNLDATQNLNEFILSIE